MTATETHAELLDRFRALQERFDEAEETLRALRAGEVDAIVASGTGADHVYTLRGADAAYRVMVEGMAEGALTLAADGLILFSNEQFATLVRRPLARVIGSRFADFIAPEDTVAAASVLNGSVRKAEVRLCAEGALLVPVYLSAESLVLDGARCLCLIVTDLTDQKKRNEKIVEAEKLARLVADAMPQIVWTACPDGQVDHFNQRWYDFTGFPRETAGDANWEPILHPDDAHVSAEAWRSAVESGRPWEVQCRFSDLGNGNFRWHLGRALPLRDDRGSIIKWVGTWTDIDDHKRLSDELERRVDERTRELRRLLGEKTMLLKEVHHRVKNNLQVVCSLLSMQIGCSESSLFSRPLNDAHCRVLAMSLIHEQIYQSDTLADLNFGEYIERLANRLFTAYCVDPARIGLRLEVEAIHLTVDQAIPCGLILNELISNSLKHAFPPSRREGMIRVSLRHIDRTRIELEVADNGCGLPTGSHWEDGRSLGLQVVRTLIHQLRAELSVAGNGGTSFRFSWNLPSAENASIPRAQPESSPAESRTLQASL
jgi:PAS domain S-box-containing protein